MSTLDRLNRISEDDKELIYELFCGGTSINELCVNFVLCRELVLLVIKLHP